MLAPSSSVLPDPAVGPFTAAVAPLIGSPVSPRTTTTPSVPRRLGHFFAWRVTPPPPRPPPRRAGDRLAGVAAHDYHRERPELLGTLLRVPGHAPASRRASATRLASADSAGFGAASASCASMIASLVGPSVSGRSSQFRIQSTGVSRGSMRQASPRAMNAARSGVSSMPYFVALSMPR